MAGAQDQSGCSGSGGKEEKKKKYNTTLQKYLTDKLEETGEKERLTELLKERLIECGWRDELKVYCREKMAARAKKGSASLNVDALTREVIVHAQGQQVHRRASPERATQLGSPTERRDWLAGASRHVSWLHCVE